MVKLRFEWRCPHCAAPSNACGNKPTDECNGTRGEELCMGFICECSVDNRGHGSTLDDPCTEAHCYHCGWTGAFPRPPKGLQPWEKKALQAGWSMPEARAAELKQVTK